MSTTRCVSIAAAVLGSAALVLLEMWPDHARAHLGSLPLAPLVDPAGTSSIADTSFTFHWFDSNRAVATGTATVKIYYTHDIPPTFPQGVIPETLTGTVVHEVLETDTANSFTWDTTNVPTGTYW